MLKWQSLFKNKVQKDYCSRLDDVLAENKALRAFDPEEMERAVEDAKRREAQERNRELEVHIMDTYTKD